MLVRGHGSFSARSVPSATVCRSQYTRSAGDMQLVTRLAADYSEKLGRPITATTEV